VDLAAAGDGYELVAQKIPDASVNDRIGREKTMASKIETKTVPFNGLREAADYGVAFEHLDAEPRIREGLSRRETRKPPAQYDDIFC